MKRCVLPANFNAVIASDGSGLGSSRVGGPNNLAAGRHNTLSLPHHGNHWARDDVLYQGAEERLGGEVRVVLLSEGSLHLDHLHGCSGPRHLRQNSHTKLQRLPIYMQGIHPSIEPELLAHQQLCGYTSSGQPCQRLFKIKCNHPNK